MAVAGAGAPHNGPFFGASLVSYMAILKDIKQQMFSAITNTNTNTNEMSKDKYKDAVSRAINAIGTGITNFATANMNAIDTGSNVDTRNPNLLTKTPTDLFNKIRNINNSTINTIGRDNIHTKTDQHIVSYEQEASVTTNTIQDRIDGCYVLEGLYINKHSELIKMFKFAKLLYEKFYYTLKILLFVLSLLTGHVCDPGGSGGPGGPGVPPHPININLPKPLIKNINALLTDQKTMMDIIDTAGTTLTENAPLNFNPDVQDVLNRKKIFTKDTSTAINTAFTIPVVAPI